MLSLPVVSFAELNEYRALQMVISVMRGILFSAVILRGGF